TLARSRMALGIRCGARAPGGVLLSLGAMPCLLCRAASLTPTLMMSLLCAISQCDPGVALDAQVMAQPISSLVRANVADGLAPVVLVRVSTPSIRAVPVRLTMSSALACPSASVSRYSRRNAVLAGQSPPGHSADRVSAWP